MTPEVYRPLVYSYTDKLVLFGFIAVGLLRLTFKRDKR